MVQRDVRKVLLFFFVPLFRLLSLLRPFSLSLSAAHSISNLFGFLKDFGSIHRHGERIEERGYEEEREQEKSHHLRISLNLPFCY